MVGEPKDDWGDDDDDVEEATRELEEWMIMAWETGTLVDDDVDMSKNENKAEAETEETSRGMEIDEDDFNDRDDMDITEYTKYEDWLEKELSDMNVDGGTRDLVFREENITRMLNEKNVRNVNNMKPDLISKEAYENGGSWVMDRWVCPTVRRGRGKNEDNVCPGPKRQ